MFSSVATDFGSWTICKSGMKSVDTYLSYRTETMRTLTDGRNTGGQSHRREIDDWTSTRKAVKTKYPATNVWLGIQPI